MQNTIRNSIKLSGVTLHSGEISNVLTAGKVGEQTVTPNPPDADPDETFTYNETTNFFEQPTVTYQDDKDSDPK